MAPDPLLKPFSRRRFQGALLPLAGLQLRAEVAPSQAFVFPAPEPLVTKPRLLTRFSNGRLVSNEAARLIDGTGRGTVPPTPAHCLTPAASWASPSSPPRRKARCPLLGLDRPRPGHEARSVGRGCSGHKRSA